MENIRPTTALEIADRVRAGGGGLLVISGPSGCGKSSICRRLLEDPRIVFSISVTTRAPRTGEVDGRDYHFVGKEEFVERMKRGEFIESAEVHGNLYGTLWKPLEDALAAGLVYLVEIDVQGALQLKGQGIEGMYVFVDAPDDETLRQRLEGRGTDAPEVIERRLKKSLDERLERDKYDHIVVNAVLEQAIADVRGLAGLDAHSGADATARGGSN